MPYVNLPNYFKDFLFLFFENKHPIKFHTLHLLKVFGLLCSLLFVCLLNYTGFLNQLGQLSCRTVYNLYWSDRQFMVSFNLCLIPVSPKLKFKSKDQAFGESITHRRCVLQITPDDVECQAVILLVMLLQSLD